MGRGHIPQAQGVVVGSNQVLHCSKVLGNPHHSSFRQDGQQAEGEGLCGLSEGKNIFHNFRQIEPR